MIRNFVIFPGNHFLSISCEALASLDVFTPHEPRILSSMPRTIQWIRDTGYYVTGEGKDGISVNMRRYDRVLYQKNFASYSLLHQAPPGPGDRAPPGYPRIRNAGIFPYLHSVCFAFFATTFIFNWVDHLLASALFELVRCGGDNFVRRLLVKLTQG